MKISGVVGLLLLAMSVGGCDTTNPEDRAMGGALIGGATGAAIGGAAGGNAKGALIGAGIGTLGGALVGAATAPTNASRRTVVYEDVPPPPPRYSKRECVEWGYDRYGRRICYRSENVYYER